MSECSKCGELIYVPAGLDFDDEVDLCHDCLVDQVATLTEEVATLEAEHTADQKELLAALENNGRLRAALAPFAAVAAGIASNWPGYCRLREGAAYRKIGTPHSGAQGWHQWLEYWGANEGGSFPTIDEWRAAAEACEAKKETSCKT
jgi:hypothetical protein